MELVERVVFKPISRKTNALGSADAAAAISISSFKVMPGCSASNPFSVAASGLLTSLRSELSILDCPAMKLTVSLSMDDATATCEVIMRAASSTARSSSPGLAVGSAHMCYIARASPAMDWGGTLSCFAAPGDSSAHMTPIPVLGSTGHLQVAVGDAHTCVLDVAGQVSCVGTAAGRGGGTEHLWRHSMLVKPKYAFVAAGKDFTCAILRGAIGQGDTLEDYRRLECRGSNMRLVQAYATLGRVWDASSVGMVAVGTTVACAILDSDQSLQCFGAGENSFLSQVPAGSFDTVSVSDTPNACAIAAHTGQMSCWGDLWGGSVHVYTDSFDGVALGSNWLCAIQSSDKSLACFGMYVPFVFPSYGSVPSTPVAQVSASGQTLCVVHQGGQVECFGQLARAARTTVGAVAQQSKAVLTAV